VIIHQCDSCGDEYDHRSEGQGACVVAISPPRKPKNHPGTLHEWFQQGADGVEEHKFDLCRECALALMVTLKQRKLDRQQGRSVFST
jgi:hypothetical protein